MKTLIYTMQSSGASLFTYWLAQQDNCISVLDLYNSQVAPNIDHKNVILKCVVSNKINLDLHLNSFKPDRTILFLRNPIQNYLSLYEKPYGDDGGTVAQKMQILDQALVEKTFDLVIKYEDFIMKKELPVGDASYYNFSKSLKSIISYNCLNNQWCKDNYRKKWGMGNIHADKLKLFQMDEHIPNLYQLYRGGSLTP